eukprot:scaffold367670_cov18-Prasinocladus_malaysianus.AAC.1
MIVSISHIGYYCRVLGDFSAIRWSHSGSETHMVRHVESPGPRRTVCAKTRGIAPTPDVGPQLPPEE